MEDLGMLKDFPAFKLIMKTIIRSQIQGLIEELAKHTEEETVILSANMSDGSITHLGSKSGKRFVKDNEELKSSFLSFCLKDKIQMTNAYPPLPTSTSTSTVSTPPPRAPAKTKSKRYEPYPVNLIRTMENTNEIQTLIDATQIKSESITVDDDSLDQPVDQSYKFETEGDTYEDDNSVDTSVNLNDSSTPAQIIPIGSSDSTASNVDWGLGVDDSQMLSLEQEQTSRNQTTGFETANHLTSLNSGPTAPVSEYYTEILNSQSETRRGTDFSQSQSSKTNFDQPKKSNSSRSLNIYQCQLCPKSFNRHDFLERHIRIHTGEKPFSCQVCGKAFNVKSNMKTHMYRHVKSVDKLGNYTLKTS